MDAQDRQRRVDPGDELLGRDAVVGDADEPGDGVDVGREPEPAQLGVERRAIGGIEQHRPIEQLALHLVGRADDRDAAVVDDAHPVGLLGLLEVVRRQEDGRAVGVADLAEVVPQAAAADRVEARGRLVEEQHPGPMHEAADDLELALHAARERLERLVDVVAEPDDVGELLDALAVLGGHRAVERPVRVQAVDRDVEADVLLAREVLVDARVLEDDPDVAPDGGRLAIEVVAGDGDRAAGLGQGRGQDADGGGLAGAVGPEEGEELARPDLEADVVDRRGRRLLVALRQVLDRDDRRIVGGHGVHAAIVAADCGALVETRWRVGRDSPTSGSGRLVPPTMAAMTTDYVRVPGGRLRVVDEGQGPPIVLLHAGIANLRSWDAWRRYLVAAGYRVVRYDQRGFGETTTEAVPFSNRADVDRACSTHLGIGRAALVGNSRGGVIAFDTAIEFPDRVVAVVGVGAGLGGFEGDGDARGDGALRGDGRASRRPIRPTSRRSPRPMSGSGSTARASRPTRVPSAIREAVRAQQTDILRPDRVERRPDPARPAGRGAPVEPHDAVLAVAGALDARRWPTTARHLEAARPGRPGPHLGRRRPHDRDGGPGTARGPDRGVPGAAAALVVGGSAAATRRGHNGAGRPPRGPTGVRAAKWPRAARRDLVVTGGPGAS